MRRSLSHPLAAVLLAVVTFSLVLRLQPGGPSVARAVDDVGQLLAAVVAAVTCAWRARRCEGRAARSWLLLAAATGSWAGGELAWSYYELLAGRQTPFPSIADAGFLTFDLLAVAALLLWPSTALRGGARWRALLDGVLVAGALFILSWVTALGTTVRGGGDSRFAYVVSLGYPVLDLVLLTLTIVVVAHARQAIRSGLGRLAIGLVCLSVADSGFAYLTAVGRYATGSPVDAGWFGGFLLIATAAYASTSAPVDSQIDAPALESTPQTLLPYVPAGVGLAVAVTGQLTGRGDRVGLVAVTLVVTALLARQLLALLDNRRLVHQVVETQQQLRYQAFHDPLTRLANRALFTDRLRHGVELHRRDLRPLSLLYCDLDGFKSVNDTYGHDAGDAVLQAAAERLRAVTRTGDTVARMGGDEFAILLEDGGDTGTAVARILEAFTQPAHAGRDSVPLGVSIGVAHLSSAASSVTPEVFLQRADAAMYAAKRGGKGIAVTWPDLAGNPDPPRPRSAADPPRTGPGAPPTGGQPERPVRLLS